MSTKKLAPVILAAGKGTRMVSEMPKVLHPLADKPMLTYALDLAEQITDEPPVVVLGFEAEKVQKVLDDRVRVVFQSQQLGTGHALNQASEILMGQSELILVWAADMPLLSVELLEKIVDCQRNNNGPMSIVTAQSDNHRGFGKIVRSDEQKVQAIVEQIDATEDQLSITEINVGVYCFASDWLWKQLNVLKPSASGEYYLTDLVECSYNQSKTIGVITVTDNNEIIGINNRVHLAEAENSIRRQTNNYWMEKGVTLQDPENTYISPDVKLGKDTIVLPNTHLTGNTKVGDRCVIGPNTTISDTIIGDDCKVKYSVIEMSVLENEVDVGPFGHLRAGSHLSRGVHIGNFGEVKNSHLGRDVKMGHFSYIGDATVGERTNIGAGSITCNFGMDKQKHRTVIGDDVFIGSDTMLVAPLKIGSRAKTGAGSVVTKDVPKDSLAVGVPARVIVNSIKKGKDGEQ